MRDTPNAPTSRLNGGSEKLLHVMQGHLEASRDPNIVLTTILGSCVSTCLYDSEARIGGMNHFLLPKSSSPEAGSNRYGVHAMELLINDLLKQGAQKKNMVAKVFGGADMLSTEMAIGQRNVSFAMAFLQDESIPCVSKSLGGQQARRVRFWPQSGLAKLKFIDNDQTLFREPDVVQPGPKAAGDIELF